MPTYWTSPRKSWFASRWPDGGDPCLGDSRRLEPGKIDILVNFKHITSYEIKYESQLESNSWICVILKKDRNSKKWNKTWQTGKKSSRINLNLKLLYAKFKPKILRNQDNNILPGYAQGRCWSPSARSPRSTASWCPTWKSHRGRPYRHPRNERRTQHLPTKNKISL